MELTDALKRRARALGFCAVGITSAEPFHEAEAAAADRSRQGLMDGLPWWSEARVHASADPRRATPDARSVIALAFPHPASNSPSPSGEGRDSPSPLVGEGRGGGRDSPSPLVGEGRGGGSLDDDGPRGRVAAYALGRDYHEVLLERMQPLLAMLREQGHVAKTYVDHGWMLDRAAAARAGIGWLGKTPTCSSLASVRPCCSPRS